MGLFPNLMAQWSIAWRVIPRMVQPSMPIGTDPACFALTVKDHPTALVIGGMVIHISLIVATNTQAFAPCEQLGAYRLTVPPGHCP
jgi:hypothetical protein